MGSEIGEVGWAAGEQWWSCTVDRTAGKGRVRTGPVRGSRQIKSRVKSDKSFERDTDVGRECVGVMGFLQ